MLNIVDTLLNRNKLIKEAKELIKKIYLSDKIPWVIGYSGGKDSTTTTQLIIETIMELKNEINELHKHIYIISSDTLVETPMIKNIIIKSISNINTLAKNYHLPMSAHIIRPEFGDSFWVNIIGRGYPSPNQTFRWCTDRLKINPANKFIKEIVDKFGEVVMILGVRDGESNSRDRVLESHTIEGKSLMRHSTMPNAYVFAPIRKFSIDDLWNYLLNNPSPWGSNNKELFKLYSDSSSECPLIVDEETKKVSGSCGNSRFGCWVCTVVKEDRSLSGFIKNGETWLKPLLEFRNWLFNIRDNDDLRMKRRTNGDIYFSKIKTIDENTLFIPTKGDRPKNIIRRNDINQWVDSFNNIWLVFDSINAEIEVKKYIIKNNIDLSSGENPRIIIKRLNDDYEQLGNGPFTLKTRMEILHKLLLLQKELPDSCQLINPEELTEIRKIWLKQGDWKDSVNNIFYDVFKIEFDNVENDIKLFDQSDLEVLNSLCKKENYDFNTYNELLHISRKYSGYINRKDAQKEIQKLLKKEFLFSENWRNTNED